MIYRKTVLENGLRVITEAWPHTEAASVGIWVRTGSRDERPEENGLSHFIEHLVFKGTRRRSALDIVREIESVGGTINAFTAKEYTCFHAKVLDKDLPLALDVLCDLLTEPLFDPVELEKERMVILQEIKMADDVPDDHIYDLFHRSFWGDHPLGLPIIGTKETVSSFSREQIEGFFRRRYTPERMIVAAAGHIEHEEVVREVERRLGSIPPSDDHRPEPRAEGGKGGVGVEYRELEQVHLCLGVRGIPYAHPNRFAGYVLHTILGGNMSSRLFQEIREKRGLTYSVYSFMNSYRDSGVLGVYAGTTKEELDEVIDLILRELRRMKAGEIEEREVQVAKEYLKGNMALALESSDGRMSRLAKNEIYFGRHIPLEEALRELDRVDVERVLEATREFFNASFNLVLLGSLKEEEVPLSETSL